MRETDGHASRGHEGPRGRRLADHDGRGERRQQRGRAPAHRVRDRELPPAVRAREREPVHGLGDTAHDHEPPHPAGRIQHEEDRQGGGRHEARHRHRGDAILRGVQADVPQGVEQGGGEHERDRRRVHGGPATRGGGSGT